MAQKQGSIVICTECTRPLLHQGRVKRSFLGFGRFNCPQCGKDFRSPLPKGYSVTYWILALGLPVGCIVMAFYSNFALPGILWICIIVALAGDASLKKRVVGGIRG
jgi:uncharacterized protein (DUF983 family)